MNHSTRFGLYRLCATGPHHTVVLRFPDRTWVVSPARLEEFICAVRERTDLHWSARRRGFSPTHGRKKTIPASNQS